MSSHYNSESQRVYAPTYTHLSAGFNTPCPHPTEDAIGWANHPSCVNMCKKHYEKFAQEEAAKDEFSADPWESPEAVGRMIDINRAAVTPMISPCYEQLESKILPSESGSYGENFYSHGSPDYLYNRKPLSPTQASFRGAYGVVPLTAQPSFNTILARAPSYETLAKAAGAVEAVDPKLIMGPHEEPAPPRKGRKRTAASKEKGAKPETPPTRVSPRKPKPVSRPDEDSYVRPGPSEPSAFRLSPANFDITPPWATAPPNSVQEVQPMAPRRTTPSLDEVASRPQSRGSRRKAGSEEGSSSQKRRYMAY